MSKPWYKRKWREVGRAFDPRRKDNLSVVSRMLLWQSLYGMKGRRTW